jgi:DNA-binding NarL/FixJ family response regulator
MITVVVADDQELIPDGLRMILDAQDDVEVIGEASDGRTVLALSRQLRPDVVLMDIVMPHLDGIEATRRLQAEPEPRPLVLILTTYGEDEQVYAALAAGPSGFLLKDAPRARLAPPFARSPQARKCSTGPSHAASSNGSAGRPAKPSGSPTLPSEKWRS